MAVVGASNPTLADWAKTRDPEGKTADIVELLAQTNDMLVDMTAVEGNQAMGTLISQRVGLPTAYYRVMNQGVPSSKSRTVQITEGFAMLEARSEIDQALAELNGDVSAYRMEEAAPFIEAMNQKWQDTLIYGSNANPEEYPGLATRYGSLSAANGGNIIDAGGTGSDNTSIYLIGWHPTTVAWGFPKGSNAGLQHEDLGLGDAFDASNNRFRAYMDHWKMNGGLVVRDWRYVVRIANIDVSNLLADGAGSSVKLMEYMTKALHRIPAKSLPRLAFYANRTVHQMLDIQAVNKGNVLLDVGSEEGEFKTTFRRLPLRTVDRILNTEARVV